MLKNQDHPREHQASDKVGVRRVTKNTYGVDCECGWSVTITTKNAFATTETHAVAWAQAHPQGLTRPEGYQDPREDPMASRATQRAAQAKAADVKARSDANSQAQREAYMREANRPLADQVADEKAAVARTAAAGRAYCNYRNSNRPSYREVAEQYGDRILKGREEFHYTWQGIAEVLHLIPRGNDVPRNVKVWGHMVIWNAYKLLKAQRGEEPVRKQLRGRQKANGHAQVDHTATHNPNEPAKPSSNGSRANRPARTPAQRRAKALGLEALELAELIDRVQGRTISYVFNDSALGSATTMVAKVRKVQPTGRDGRLAMWFFADVAVVGKAKTAEYSNERTVYLDQIVEVS